ncbi:MAG TPA: FAD-dependent oxidoreductase [Macromonas sp.]|nr:FAD-dependent oxidoreductase [Macromonas sp.]
MQGKQVLIIGNGTGGFQAASALRDAGHEGPITLIGDEAPLPYHRPPLSKAYLLGQMDEPRLLLRQANFYEEKKIDLVCGRRAVSIDRLQRRVTLDDGTQLPYDHLLLATGARNRPLTVPGSELAGVHYMRTMQDALQLKQELGQATDAVVIGAGFIGLEFAAAARKAGLNVTVLDVAQRAMGRAVSPHVSAVFERAHRRDGTRLLFGTGVSVLLGEGGRVRAVQTSDGQEIPCQLVVVGIGVLPNQEIARDAGLAVGNGIEVDACMRTSDPAISAIGDVASFPCVQAGGERVRLESVQGANDQARLFAQVLVKGTAAPYSALPWFWSDQGPLKLQIAGLTTGFDRAVVQGQDGEDACSVFCFRGERLLGVESINRPADHMAARKLLAPGATLQLTPEQAAADGFELKSFVLQPAD